MFIRFLTHDGRGLFRAAYDLLYSDDIPECDLVELRELLDWFRDELPIPPSGVYARFRDARTWFIDDECSYNHMAKATLLAQLIDQHREPMRIIRRKRIGCIVHQDRFQAIAQHHWAVPTGTKPKASRWKNRRDRSTIRRL